MIILRDVPGITTADIMGAIGDMVPLENVQTGHGGIVVDESTALLFLQRYFGAIEEHGAAIPGSSAPTRRGRRR
jgi:hypothetical protein